MIDALIEYITNGVGVALDAMSPDDILSQFNAKNVGHETLEQHDRRFHKGGYKIGDTCKFRDAVYGEANKTDDLPLFSSSNKEPDFKKEDIDIGTDPLEEIQTPTDNKLFPSDDDIGVLEKYADDIDSTKQSTASRTERDDWFEDMFFGDGEPEADHGHLPDDMPPEDNDSEVEDYYSWLDSLNSNPYKSRVKGGPMTDYIFKPEKKIHSFSNPLPSVSYDDGTTLENGDITKFKGDAIVNAANKYMLGGGGVDGAIHRAAGLDLLAECKKIVPYDKKNGYRCKTGDAKITKAGNLPCRYVIHTVGPDMYAREGNETANLASAYRKSMQLAYSNGCKTIAFPSISTGIFAFPLEQAAQIAASEIHKFEKSHPDFKVTMCLSKGNMDAYKKAFSILNGKKTENGESENVK